jgi:hypothetical protein
MAGRTEGILTPTLMYFLNDSLNPIDLKMALINKLGSDFDGKNNEALFLEFLQAENNYDDVNVIHKLVNAEILICIAYLKAMDNYHNVSEAIGLARLAKYKSQNSYTIHMIAALIEAQKLMRNNFCKTYETVNKVRLNNEMKESAVNMIFDYMNLYKENCD